MMIKKKDSFEARCDEVARLLKLIAHPNKLRILCCLIDGDKTVSELEEYCGASQSSVSQYLVRMKSEKILTSKREGQTIRYSLSNLKIKKLLKKMQSVFC